MIDVATIAYAAAVVIPFAIGFLVSKGVVSKDTLVRDAQYAQMAVQAAEELYRGVPKSGQEKLEAAVSNLIAKTGLDEDEASTLVLAAVKGLRDAGLLPPGPAKPAE